mmetsp:Transcript_86538/g.222916  ORF Transcript_86538/g.222916 Transcript_86538/m.222916 type:complete len:562 (+) Transcript_86538:157-1842(+)
MGYASYSFIRWILTNAVKVFFRQIDIVGLMRVPVSGPVIFVANHNNQFVDPMLLISALPRILRFLIAGKSLRRPLVGSIARMARAIGVERAQDLAFKGQGSVTAQAQATTVQGTGTSFLKELTPGCKMNVDSDLEFAVKSVESDTSCTVDPCPRGVSSVDFKILPRIDQKHMYSQVNEALKSGDCIGIFPEGGSHDRASLLDLKPGVAIMALGAMQAGAGQVQIVPCGLNYFDAYRFRSRVVVEFAEPFSVPTDLVELYGKDKRLAVQKLMDMVHDAMQACTPGAKDYDEHQALITMRALYKPRGKQMTPEESLKLTKYFANARRQLRDDSRMDKVIEMTRDYNDLLRATGLRDRDVRLSLVPDRGMAWRTISAALQLILLSPITLSALFLGMPVIMTTKAMAIREKEKALKSSTVKVKALDVVASYKILVGLVLVPIYSLFLAAVAVLLFKTPWWFLFVFYLFIIPLYFYIGIVACDHSVRAFRRFRSTILFYCCTPTAVILKKGLVERRNELQQLVRSLVEELGSKTIDFPSECVIKLDDLETHASHVQSLVAPLLPRH